LNAHWEKKKEGCGERTLIQRLAILVLACSMWEWVRVRDRERFLVKVLVSFYAPFWTMQTQVFCS